jgi:DNA mismatch repair protein MutS
VGETFQSICYQNHQVKPKMSSSVDQSSKAKPDNTAIKPVTPMMAQYIEIKAANPGSLLFYRMGDFYELFFDDAEQASRALGITLTKRGKHLGEDIPMCGVPVVSADDYLQKLIKLDFRVSVCEQVEDPAEAKKRGHKSVVRREVKRLVTPGTLTEEKLLDPTVSNFLCALAHIKGASNDHDMALSWIDISTGSFQVVATGAARLAADLARIEPKELILADSVFHDPLLRPIFDVQKFAVTPQPSVLFESTTAEARLARFFGVKTLSGFGDFSRVEIAAASAAVAYVEKTQIGEVPSLARPVRENSSATLFIDAATRANLELTRTLSGEKQGSLLRCIDRTISGGGARLLAERLMSPLTAPNMIAARQDEIAFMLVNDLLSQDLRTAFKGTPDMPRALSRLSLNRGGPRDMGAVQKGIESARMVVDLFDNAPPPPMNIADALEKMHSIPGEVSKHLLKALDDELPLLKRDGGFVRSGYNAELDALRELRDRSRQIIAGLQADYATETDVKSLKIRHNNVLGYFIEVTALNAAALTSDEGKARFIHRQTLANCMRFTTTELAELESKIANAAGKALEIELAIFDELAREIVAIGDKIKSAALALSSLDVATGFARLAEEQGYARPKVDDSLSFDIVAGRHAVVEQMLRRDAADPFVANDCNIGADGDNDQGKIWLLTGPNMGGKSTFLRQNALIVILAQMGSFVPAGSAHIGVVDRLFSRVGAADDLARGRSTFMVEMVETAAILNQAGPRALVILDEIGRGTATFDGLSIAWATIEHLHEANKCRTLFATHFHELTALAEPLENLANVTLKVKEWDGDVVFLHEVIPGSADRSYGIQVARLAGLPEAVVARARIVLEQLEKTDRKAPGAALIDDLPLFSVKQRPTSKKTNPDQPLNNHLATINPDELTPREALEALYALKVLASETKTKG